jgi:diguanylate cyclase (GGDEF)-like protein
MISAIIGELADAAAAAIVAGKIIQAVSQPISYKGHRISVGTSIGIAIFPDDSEDASELRHLADVAMYAAKAAGKNRHGFAATR